MALELLTPAADTAVVVVLRLRQMAIEMDMQVVIPLRIKVAVERRFTSQEHIPTPAIALRVGQVLPEWDLVRKAPVLTTPMAEQVALA